MLLKPFKFDFAKYLLIISVIVILSLSAQETYASGGGGGGPPIPPPPPPPPPTANGAYIIPAYHASPHGDYGHLRLVPREEAAMGGCTFSKYGTLFVNEDEGNALWFCQDDGVMPLHVGVWQAFGGLWTQNAADDSVYLTETTTNPNLKVGIGTSEPDDPLHVMGSIILKDLDPEFVFEKTPASTGPAEIRVLGDGDTDLNFRPAGVGDVNFAPGAASNNTFGIYPAGELAFNPNNAVFIANTAYKSVGINRVPSRSYSGLEVQSIAGTDGIEHIIEHDDPSLVLVDNDIAYNIDKSDFKLGTRNGRFIFTSFINHIGTFPPTPMERIFVDRLGNVGIGEEEPARLLHISTDYGNVEPSAILFQDDSTANTYQWHLQVDPDSDFRIHGGDIADMKDRLSIRYNDNSGAVHYDGNVGIGIDDPANIDKSLHIGPDAGNGGKMRLEGTETMIEFYPVDPNRANEPHFRFLTGAASYGSNSFEIWTDQGTGTWTDAIRFGYNAKTGINGSGVLDALHVLGDDADPYHQDFRIVSDRPGLIIKTDEDTRPDFWMALYDQDVRFAVNAASDMDDTVLTNPAMTIKLANGRVGIGTSDPQGTLDVNGSIKVGSVVVHPDYVFEPDYKMLELGDYIDFIKKNKGLEAIPRPLYKENGQKTVDIDKQSVGVIEELEKLHIYIEQLHKRTQQVEKVIQELESTKNQPPRNSF